MNSRITILLRHHHFPCSSKFQIFTIGLSCNGVAPSGKFPAHVSCWKHSTWPTEFGKQRLTKLEVDWSSVLMSSKIHSLLSNYHFPLLKKFQMFTTVISCDFVWFWLNSGNKDFQNPELSWSSVLLSSNIHSLLGTLIFPRSSNSRYFKLGHPAIFSLQKSLQLMHCASVNDKNHINYQKKIVKLEICAHEFEHS